MAETSPTPRRLSPATIALVLAGLLAAAAIAIAAMRSSGGGGEETGNASANMTAPAQQAPNLDATAAALRERLRQAARERRATLRPWAATASDVARVLAGAAHDVVAGAAR